MVLTDTLTADPSFWAQQVVIRQKAQNAMQSGNYKTFAWTISWQNLGEVSARQTQRVFVRVGVQHFKSGLGLELGSARHGTCTTFVWTKQDLG